MKRMLFLVCLIASSSQIHAGEFDKAVWLSINKQRIEIAHGAKAEERMRDGGPGYELRIVCREILLETVAANGEMATKLACVDATLITDQGLVAKSAKLVYESEKQTLMLEGDGGKLVSLEFESDSAIEVTRMRAQRILIHLKDNGLQIQGTDGAFNIEMAFQKRSQPEPDPSEVRATKSPDPIGQYAPSTTPKKATFPSAGYPRRPELDGN